jgi:hypothetical protein
MKPPSLPASCRRRRARFGLLFTAFVLGCCSAIAAGYTVGGSQGGGGIPYTERQLPTPTAGCVVDGLHSGIQNLQVVVTAAGGSVVAWDITGVNGEFVVVLPHLSGMELSVVGTSASGIPVEAGEPIVVVIP